MKQARRTALEALMDITEKGAYANLSLKRFLEGFDCAQAKWVSALVYETLEHLYYIDYLVSDIARGKLKPHIRAILRISFCQMLFMNVPAGVACDEAVKLTKQIGKGALSGYVNAVMRELARRVEALKENEGEEALKSIREHMWSGALIKAPSNPVERLSIQYSWPRFMVDELIAQYGAEEAQRILGAKPLPMQIRAQPPFSTQELLAALNERDIPYALGEYDSDCVSLLSGFDISKDELFLQGKITAQSESAMLVCRCCNGKPGIRLLDACASPGGKSAYIYALAGDIELHAWELKEHRLKLLENTLNRLNVKANTAQRDATSSNEEFAEYFDVILTDVPCSALGSGKPDKKYTKTPEDIDAIAKTQQAILNACSKLLKKGGELIYSTCTVSHKENEAQMNEFLKTHPGFKLTPLPDFLPGGQDGFIQLMPHRHGLDAFFIAKFIKE